MSLVKSPFPVILNPNEYRIELYSNASQGGWKIEINTLIVNEAKGFCQIEYDISEVRNSHGTDWDDNVYLSDPYTLEEAARLLENQYSPGAINAKSPTEREFYNSSAYTHAPRLRAAGKAYASEVTVTQKLLKSLLTPEEELISSFFSETSAVFTVKSKKTGVQQVIKLSPVPRAHKGKMLAVLENLGRLEDTQYLVPTESCAWLPLDNEHEVLAIRMPKLESIPTRRDGSGKLHYESMDDFNGKGQLHRIGRDLAAALSLLHKNGLVHHDVKPENILFNRDKKCWCLGDFGSAKPVELQYQVNTSATIAFAAPEILKKQPYSFSCDVYSWGRTMLFLATGVIPDRNTPASLEWNPRGIILHAGSDGGGRYKNHINLHFYGIVAKALSENPADRYPSATELLAELDRFLVTSAQKPTEYQIHQAFTKANFDYPWKTYSFGFARMDYVYWKAMDNAELLKHLARMKEKALEETKDHYVAYHDFTPGEFDRREQRNKEGLADSTSKIGIESLHGSLTEPKLFLKLTDQYPKVSSCANFNIIANLGNYEGGYNILHPQVTLEVHAPKGCRHGVQQLEKLTGMLFPWISIVYFDAPVKNAPSGVKPSAPPKPVQKTAAPPPAPPKPVQKPVHQPPAASASPVAPPKPAAPPAATPKPAAPPPIPPASPTTPSPAPSAPEEKKPGFFARLFGKKGGSAAPLSPQEKFYQEMKAKPVFRNTFSCAAAEINSALIRQQVVLKNPSGGPLTLSQWQTLSEIQQMEYILLLGGRSITPSVLLCIDFAEVIPYCLAIALLYLAYTGQHKNQMLDTGDGTDSSVLKIAVENLLPCCPGWQCKIF